MIQTLVTRWVWQPPDPPCNYGSRAPGPACLTEDREMHQGRHARALGTAPRSTAIFFFTPPENSSLYPCLRLSGAFQEESKREFHLHGTFSRPWRILPKWCPGLETGGGLVEAVAAGLPMKLSPLLSIPGVGPSVVAGGGLAPGNRAAVSPALMFPPAHSCSLTSPHHDPEWPEAPLHEWHH